MRTWEGGRRTAGRRADLPNQHRLQIAHAVEEVRRVPKVRVRQGSRVVVHAELPRAKEADERAVEGGDDVTVAHPKFEHVMHLPCQGRVRMRTHSDDDDDGNDDDDDDDDTRRRHTTTTTHDDDAPN